MQRASLGTRWAAAPRAPDFTTHQVHVWRVFLDASADQTAALARLLSSEEKERASRFRFGRHSSHFAVAHAALREILATYLRCEPVQLVFEAGIYGKPALKAAGGLEFNLAHSGSFALIAVALRRRVGIDIEAHRELGDLNRIARRFFSEHENHDLEGFPPHRRGIAFFDCWTRKEAYIKGQGLGLSLPLDSFDVSLAPGEPAALRATRPDAGGAAKWSLHSFDVATGYSAAVAVQRRPMPRGELAEAKLAFWDWPTSLL